MPYQYASIRDYVIFEPPPTLQPVSLSFSKEDNSTASSFPKIIIICTVHYEPKAISCAFLPIGFIVTSMTYIYNYHTSTSKTDNCEDQVYNFLLCILSSQNGGWNSLQQENMENVTPYWPPYYYLNNTLQKCCCSC